MMVQASTLPNWVKYFLSDSGVTTNLVLPKLREIMHDRVPSVVSQFSPPMNILLHVRVVQSKCDVVVTARDVEADGCRWKGKMQR